MKKTKSKYAVFYVSEGCGVFAPKHKTFIGETWAVSEAQACNNVRNRYKSDNYPNGGYSFEIVGDVLEEGSVMHYYEAQKI